MGGKKTFQPQDEEFSKLVQVPGLRMNLTSLTFKLVRIVRNATWLKLKAYNKIKLIILSGGWNFLLFLFFFFFSFLVDLIKLV